nr:PREDICTED: uncharacterized protein LOC105664214 [Megachile rotundata]
MSGRPSSPSVRRLCQWMDRGHGRLSFRLTQVLTGHGCFAQYLCRIGRERSPGCHHCGVGPDTVEHTVEECPAWAWPRHYLECEVGVNVSVNVLVERMLHSENEWKAVVSFSETVMSRKEAAERERQRRAGVTDSRVLRRRRRPGNPDPVSRAPS